MSFYLWSILLGAVGLTTMAFMGLSAGHGSGSAHGHGGDGHAGGGHGHSGHAHLGDGHVGHGHVGHGHVGRVHAGHPGPGTDAHVHGDDQSPDDTSSSIWALTSPRLLFSLALGFGTTGELLRPVLGGPLLLAAAIAGGIVFERVLVSPLWRFLMRFASAPATTLESAITDEATAVTAFDRNGQGIVSLEVDGQIVQILATLRADDRVLPANVRAGQRLRIDDVNVTTNSCTVSLI